MYKYSIFLIVFLVALICTSVSAQSKNNEPVNTGRSATNFESDGAIAYWDGVDNNFFAPLTGAGDDAESEQYKFSLEPNVPNPFNPATRIDYSLAEKSHVKISILDAAKQEIDVLTDEKKPAGKYSVVWYGIDEEVYAVESGTYYCRIEAGDFVQTQKMILRR